MSAGGLNCHTINKVHFRHAEKILDHYFANIIGRQLFECTIYLNPCTNKKTSDSFSSIQVTKNALIFVVA